MSYHLVLQKEGLLSHLPQVFSYLQKYHNSDLVLNPSDPVIDKSLFEWKDWTSSEFGNVNRKEELTPKKPHPRGLGFVLQAKVDADHVAATVTIRLRNDSMVYLNCVTVYCFSKNQTSVESIIFGSESVATEQCYRYL